MITKTLNAEEYKSEKRDSQDTNTSMIDISSILSLTNNKEIAWDVVESQKYAFQWFIKYMDDKRKKQIPIPEKIVWL